MGIDVEKERKEWIAANTKWFESGRGALKAYVPVQELEGWLARAESSPQAAQVTSLAATPEAVTIPRDDAEVALYYLPEIAAAGRTDSWKAARAVESLKAALSAHGEGKA
jgi:hypothetical protein